MLLEIKIIKVWINIRFMSIFVYVSDDYGNYELVHRNWGNKYFLIDLLTKRNKRKLKP